MRSRVWLVGIVGLFLLAGTTQTTQNDPRKMRGMLTDYSYVTEKGLEILRKQGDEAKAKQESDQLMEVVLTKLIGLDTLRVYVSLDKEAKELFSQSRLQSLIENRVKAMGIKLRNDSLLGKPSTYNSDYEALRETDRNMSTIVLFVDVLDTEDVWVYSVDLAVDRPGYIYPGGFYLGTVWQNSFLGLFGKGNSKNSFESQVVDTTRDLLDAFEADWRTANRRE